MTQPNQTPAPNMVVKSGRKSAGAALKSAVKRVMPRFLFPFAYAGWAMVERAMRVLQLGRSFMSDLRRYNRWAHTGKLDHHKGQQEAALLKQYHGFEKALCLPAPRPGFGQDKAKLLMLKIDQWRARHPSTDVVRAAVGSLVAYRAFQAAQNVDLVWLDHWLAGWQAELGPDLAENMGGVHDVRRADILQAVAGVVPEFFTARHSIRNFAAGEVAMADIEQAVLLASKTPSVCNRQGPKVYCFRNAMDALKWQPGNGGFGHLASRGLVITADLQAFSATGERHQAYVDGGLFAMSLVYALHSLGHGCCMLAWSQPAAAEDDLRRQLNIPANEVVIMMIAVGRLPETLKVARAYRRPVSEILQIR